MLRRSTELIWGSRSGLDRTGGKAGNDVLLGEEEGDDRWQDGEGNERQDQLPIGVELAAIDHDAERPGIEALGIEHDQGQDVAVPTTHEGDDADGGDDRARERQRDVPEEADIATAIDKGGIEELGGQIAE